MKSKITTSVRLLGLGHEYQKNNFLHMSKKVITILIMSLFATTMFAQAPQKMSYQAVVRNASDALVSNANIGMRISVLQGTANGTAVYVETQTAVTNDNGLVTLEIGGGTVVTGTFASISWGNDTYFIKTETDPTGGTNYTITGTSQFLSVPYALYAANSGTSAPSVSLTSERLESFNLTTRDQWVDCPDVSITVPETGKYLLTFFGGAFNPNLYQFTPETTALDGDTEVRVIVQGQANPLFTMIASLAEEDNSDLTHMDYYNMQPSRSALVNLTAGQVLKIQYQMYSGDVNQAVGDWYITKSGISIVKIGN